MMQSLGSLDLPLGKPAEDPRHFGKDGEESASDKIFFLDETAFLRDKLRSWTAPADRMQDFASGSGASRSGRHPGSLKDSSSFPDLFSMTNVLIDFMCG